MFGSGKPSCVRGRWAFGSGEPKCVRGKTVIPWTKVFNVILWDDLSILGLVLFFGDALRLYECDSILRMYLMFGLSATSQEMLSTAKPY